MRGGLFVVQFVVAALCAVVCGCRGSAVKGPETVPLTGKVEFTKGGTVATLADRSVVVEFESVEQPETKAFGAILEDGTFTMVTQVEGSAKPGVVPGTHRVRFNADDSGARFINSKFLTYEKSGITLKAPSDGEVVIKVWR